jgi:trans-2,3-dihydro-3-hydroxyanthranilate isomerase
VPTLRYVLVDVFTDTPLEGNQLAVFTDGRAASDVQMQALAKELGIPETVFVLRAEQGGDARIRIFTPAEELPFAGHPTLGAAFVLAAPLSLPQIRLETAAGLVTVALERDGGRISFGRMEQPLPSFEPFAQADELLAALGVARSTLPVLEADNGMRHLLVGLGSTDEIATLAPDLGAVARVAGSRGSYCFAGSGSRWTVRSFLPGVDIPEDPATGSAAGPLAAHLARHDLIAYGDEIEIAQGAAIGRPSKLFARAYGSAAALERVEVGGSAVVVARGEFRLPG